MTREGEGGLCSEPGVEHRELLYASSAGYPRAARYGSTLHPGRVFPPIDIRILHSFLSHLEDDRCLLPYVRSSAELPSQLPLIPVLTCFSVRSTIADYPTGEGVSSLRLGCNVNNNPAVLASLLRVVSAPTGRALPLVLYLHLPNKVDGLPMITRLYPRVRGSSKLT